MLPEFGYNLSDRWALGIQLGLINAEANAGTSASAWSQTFSVAPFARYTLLKWKAFSVFADGGIDFSDLTGDTNFEDGTTEDVHLTTVGLFVNPGFSLRLTDRFSLIGRTNLFTLSHAKTKASFGNAESSVWTTSLNSPFNLDDIEIGFTFNF